MSGRYDGWTNGARDYEVGRTLREPEPPSAPIAPGDTFVTLKGARRQQAALGLPGLWSYPARVLRSQADAHGWPYIDPDAAPGLTVRVRDYRKETRDD